MTAKTTATKTTTKATPAKPEKPQPMASQAPKGHPAHLLAAALDTAGLSQTGAAKAMGVAPMTLNRLVNGKGLPTAAMVLKFAAATSTDADALWHQVCTWELVQARAAAKPTRKAAAK